MEPEQSPADVGGVMPHQGSEEEGAERRRKQKTGQEEWGEKSRLKENGLERTTAQDEEEKTGRSIGQEREDKRDQERKGERKEKRGNTKGRKIARKWDRG